MFLFVSSYANLFKNKQEILNQLRKLIVICFIEKNYLDNDKFTHTNLFNNQFGNS